MKLGEALARRETILAEGSVYELLRRDPRIVFDPNIAHAGLVYDAQQRELLGDVHREYIRIGRDASLPIVAFADTWRASAERIARSSFAGRDVNGDNVRFIRGIARESSGEVIVAAYTGPRGDAYRPEQAPGRDDAKALHAPQIEALVAAEVDLIVAATLPCFEEAYGIATLLARTGIPWMQSFVVRRDGTLLDGTALAAAIARIDGEIDRPPIGYSINCVHPDVFRDAVRALGPLAPRVVALQANASSLSPEELDGSESVEGDEPARWSEAMARARNLSAIPIVGGCCGTSPEHIRALAATQIAAKGRL